MATPGEADKNAIEVDSDRRNLMKAATVAGVLGGVALASSVAQAQQAAKPAVEDPKAPDGLGKNAVPDQRFALTYQAPITEGTRVLMDHLTALSRRDIKGVADTLHYPFGSCEGTDLVEVASADSLIAKPPASLNMTMNPKRHSPNDGYMKPGCYDVFQGLEVMGTHPVNCTLALTYDRYDQYGKKLLRCEGIYAVTNNDGKWAIQFASTIFTPADMIGTVFEETIQQAKQNRIDHTLSAQTGDESFDRQHFHPGDRTFGINGGASWTAQVKGQEAVMQGYRTKGVKSRLRMGEIKADQPLRGDRGTYQDYWEGMGKLGLGPWGFIYGTWKEARVIHHTANKAHVQGSAVRYTAAGEEMSLAVQTMVVIYKNGHWSSPGNLIYATPHDRANNLHPGGLDPV